MKLLLLICYNGICNIDEPLFCVRGNAFVDNYGCFILRAQWLWQRETFFAKLLMTVILFSLIIVINITVTYGMSVVLGMPKTVIFSSSDGTRLMALFLTKIIYFAVTRIVVHMCKKDSFELAKRESLLLIFMFILLFIVCTILIRIQMKYSETGSMVLVAIFCAMLLYVFTYYMLCKISKEHSDKLRISLFGIAAFQNKKISWKKRGR